MAFTWNSVSAGTKLDADDINQARTHTNTLASNLGIAAYSWSEMPVAFTEEAAAAQISELQDALDYIDTNNTCQGHNASNFSTQYADRDSSVDATQYTAVDNDQNVTYNATQDVGVDATNYTGVDNDQHATYYNDVDAAYNSTRYITVDSDQHLTYYGVVNYSVNSTRNGTVYTGRNVTAK